MRPGCAGGAVANAGVADRLLGLVRDIAAQADGPASIARAVELAPEAVDCSLVDVVHPHRSGGLSLIHSTDPDRSGRLIQVALAAQESLATLCCPCSAPVVVADLGSDHRCERYTAAMVEASVLRSEMDIALEAGDDDWLVLRFFSDTPHAWTDGDRHGATAFAELVAVAVDRATLRGTVRNLRLGLESNRTIGAAVGILMTRHGLTYEEALGRLRSFSQRCNWKLRNLADEVVLTGDLPSGVQERPGS